MFEYSCIISNFGVQEKENLFGSVFFVSQQPNGGEWKLLFSWILLFDSFFLTSFFRERVQEDVKEHVKPFINYCCFKDEGRHLLGSWILGKINPTNCCVKCLPGLLGNFLLFIFCFSVTKWTSHEGRLQCMKEPVEKYEGEVAMSSKAT